MKVSVVIITFNEEKNIGTCLDSVKEIADEIIVVDSFSTDKTVEICQNMGVKVVQQPFVGHIEQKNFAVSQAKNNWILSLDADEVLSSELLVSIQNIKNNQHNNEGKNSHITAFSMNRLTNYCGTWIRHTDWYPDRKVRLFHREYAKWGGTNPHDEVVIEKGEAKHLTGALLHYSYHSISEHILQLNHFTNIGAQEAFARGKKAPLYKIFVNPIWKFVYSYFLRLGFLDGYKGFLVCAISAFATFTKYVKLRELHRQSK